MGILTIKRLKPVNPAFIIIFLALCISTYAKEQADPTDPTDIKTYKYSGSIESQAPQPAENIDLKDVIPQKTPKNSIEENDDQTHPSTRSNSEYATSKKEKSTKKDTIQTQQKPGPINKQINTDLSIIDKLVDSITNNPAETQTPMVLLNSKVAPGTSARLEWSPSVSFMGIAAPTSVLVVNGVKPGPTLCLTAAVHGDELNGIEIVRRVMHNTDPKVLSGALIGVPIVNLQGFQRSSRYLPDRRDLNRFFPGNEQGSSASRMAHSFFHKVVTHCDLLIDLHTGSFRRTNLPQLRADLSYQKVRDLAKKMGSIVLVQSEGAEGTLRRAATENAIPAVTLEAGAPHELQKSAVEYGVKSIEAALDKLGMLNRRHFWERVAEPIYYESFWVRATDGGILFSEIALGDEVDAGDLLGTITDPITNRRTDIVSPYDGRVIGMALNQVMYPGFAAYHIGLKSSVENVPQAKNEETSTAKLPTANDMFNDSANKLKNPTKPKNIGNETVEDAEIVDDFEMETLDPVGEEMD